MRKREDIAKDSSRKEDLIIEVLLDIRELMESVKGKETNPPLPIVERSKPKRKYNKKTK